MHSPHPHSFSVFTPLEIIPTAPSGPAAAAGLDFRIIPGSTPYGVPPRSVGLNPLRLRDSAASVPLGFGSQRLGFLTGVYTSLLLSYVFG